MSRKVSENSYTGAKHCLCEDEPAIRFMFLKLWVSRKMKITTWIDGVSAEVDLTRAKESGTISNGGMQLNRDIIDRSPGSGRPLSSEKV